MKWYLPPTTGNVLLCLKNWCKLSAALYATENTQVEESGLIATDYFQS